MVKNFMILNFHFWSLISNNDFFRTTEKHIIQEIIRNKNVKVINIFMAEEVFFSSVQELHELCFKNKININYLTGALDIESYIESGHHNPSEYRRVTVWPTFFLKYTNKFLTNSNIDYNHQTHYDFIYPMICMNGTAYSTRKLTIDLLAKHNLILENALSWHGYEPSLKSCSEYQWKYWCPFTVGLTETQVAPDHTHGVHTFNQFSIPKEYNESFLQLVTESTPFIRFITEKTAIPLFHKKLFVVIGAKNFHKGLTRLGFKLYDEIIDYSFDEIDDFELRVETLLIQINQILSNKNFNKIYQKIEEKLEYNKNHAISLANSKAKPGLVVRYNFSYYNYLYR